MRVLLSSYICGPNRGSEGGMSWNWAWHLSRYHEVWVLTRPVSRAGIEAFLAENPNENLKFLWAEAPTTLTPWLRKDSTKLVRARYWSWLRHSYQVAAAAHDRLGFDIAHHVSYNVFFPSPRLYRLPVPFIWGPVGGAMTAPSAFLKCYGRHRWSEALRNLRVGLSNRLPSLKKTVRNAELCLATNRETAEALRSAGAQDVRLMLDSVPRQDFVVPQPRSAETKRELVVMWAGWLWPRKALGLAIEAVARIKQVPVRLVVVGEGPMRHTWQKLTESLGVSDRVEFVGKVPWTEMREQYRRSDAFIFTSLRDSSGNVVFEAMASSLPIITLDHQGVGAFVPPEAAVKVAVTTPEEAIQGIAEGMEKLARNPDLRARLGAAGWNYVARQNWDYRAEVMTEFYAEVLRRRGEAERVPAPPSDTLVLADE